MKPGETGYPVPAEPEIRYAAASDGVRIALYALGEGPPFLVLPVLPMSHLLAERQFASFRAFLADISAGHTLIRYDARGLGLSDRSPADLSLDAHVRDVVSVLDKLEIEKCSIFAAAYAGPVALMLAAQHPERVDRLVLWCTHAAFADVARHVPAAQASQRDAVLGLAKTDPVMAIQAYIHHAFGWSSDEAVAGFGDLALKSTDPGQFFPRLAAYSAFDARDALPAVTAPTLVMHRPGFHGSNVEVARGLASAIRDAQLALLDGTSIVPFVGDGEAVLRAISTFLARGRPGSPGAPRSAQSAPPAGALRPGVQAILFSDIEGNTSLIEALGDDAGRRVLREHERITREELRAAGGVEVKTMGDGFLATFTSVQRALECAVALQSAISAANNDSGSPFSLVAPLGRELRVRIAINAGEPLAEDDDIFGSAVNAVARIAGQARGGEILVADVVRQLAAGKRFEFVDRGEVVLRGFSEPVRLHEVARKAPTN